MIPYHDILILKYKELYMFIDIFMILQKILNKSYAYSRYISWICPKIKYLSWDFLMVKTP